MDKPPAGAVRLLIRRRQPISGLAKAYSISFAMSTERWLFPNGAAECGEGALSRSLELGTAGAFCSRPLATSTHSAARRQHISLSKVDRAVGRRGHRSHAHAGDRQYGFQRPDESWNSRRHTGWRRQERQRSFTRRMVRARGRLEGSADMVLLTILKFDSSLH